MMMRVFEIVDSHLPAYVYLVLRYLLTECVDDGKYNAVESGMKWYVSNRRHTGDASIHGPANHVVNSGVLLPSDSVPCKRCLVWPPQAADWPT